MENRYVVLTGARNNAGDFLIKHRAKKLFAELRPDREIVDYDGWVSLNESQLEVINNSRALILLGGPSLQTKMYPGIYPLVEDLDNIIPPIIPMGVGWGSVSGEWKATHAYGLSDKTLDLLRRNQKLISVRDYYTHNLLLNYGFDNVLMTGCPAMYSIEHINKKPCYSSMIKNVSFSCGVSFPLSRKLSDINKRLILSLRDLFESSRFKVIFHHSTPATISSAVNKPRKSLYDAQKKLIEWLDTSGIAWKDISGSAEAIEDHYSNCDFHIGYRVHAHVFMASQSKPTLLIAEDGRGVGIGNVLGGLWFDGSCQDNFNIRMAKKLRNLGILKKETYMRLLKKNSYMASPFMPEDIVAQGQYEMDNDFPRCCQNRLNIDRHFGIMKRFISELP